MKNRFSCLLVSAILIVALMFTSVFAVACNKDPGGSSGSDTGGGVINPEPPEPLVPTDPEDRELYTFDALTAKVSDMYMKDVIAGGSQAVSGSLDGFLIGDVYTEVINRALTAVEGKLPAGINLNAIGINVYRGNDGNWYRTYAEGKIQQVNSCLNDILNCKIDGSEPLTIDYNLYGEKTLAYIFLDYSEPFVNMDRNWLLNALFSSSPILSGAAYTTLNEAKTLLSGTAAEREAVIVKNFGGVSADSVVGAFVPDNVKSNKFVAATLGIKISDVNAIKTAATPADALKVLATAYKGIYLGDIFGIDETMPGYIREIHTMTLSGILTAAAEGTLNDYVLDCAGTLTLNKIIKAYLPADEAVKAQYETLYQEFKALFDTTLGDIIAISNGTTTTQEFVSEALTAAYAKVKDKVLYGSITIDGIVTGIQQNVAVDQTSGKITGFDILGFANYLTTNYGQDLDGLVVYNNITVGGILDAFKQAFVAGSDGTQTFSAEEFFRILEEAFTADLDGASGVIAGLDYATLKSMVTAWFTLEADGTYDLSGIANDLFDIVYNKYFVPAGFTKEALANYLNGILGTIINADNYTALVVGGLQKITGLTAAELDASFEALTGKTLTAALAEVKTAVDANPQTTVMAELVNFAYTYKEALVSLMLSGKNTDLSAIKTIIANNTVTDSLGNSTVNYLGVMCDVYTTYRAELMEYCKASVIGAGLDSYSQMLGYDVVEKLMFKAMDDNLAALRESPAALAVIAKEYTQNAMTVAIDYLQATVTAEGDSVLYTFTDSNGNVFDITANEVLDLLKASSYPDATATAKDEAIAALLGNAKVSTFMELIASLTQPALPAPTPTPAA